MRGTLALVGGAGLGAGLMYLLDPERGERRRSELSESLACAVNDAAERFPAVASVAADAVAGARQAASRLDAPRLVSDLSSRLDAPRRVADFKEAARRLRPEWRNGRITLRRRHPVSFLEDHRWALLGVAAGVLAAGMWGLWRREPGQVRMAITVHAPIERVFDAGDALGAARPGLGAGGRARPLRRSDRHRHRGRGEEPRPRARRRQGADRGRARQPRLRVGQ